MKKLATGLILALGACNASHEVPIRSITQPGPRPLKKTEAAEGKAEFSPTQVVNNTVVVKDAQQGYYKIGNPYLIDGVPYYPHEDFKYVEEGVASWYGPGFHGQSTSNGETFDQNRFTAAHRTLPMPSFVRVTNLENGSSISLKVNDRGPFARDRIIDVSAAAAEALGMKEKGSARVRVEIHASESAHMKSLASAGHSTDDIFPHNHSKSLQGAGTDRNVGVAPMAKAAAADFVVARPEPRPESRPAPEFVPYSSPGGEFYVQIAAYSTFDRAEAMKDRVASLGQVKIFKAVQNGQTLYKVRLGEYATRAQADAARAQVDRKGISGSRVIIKDGNELRWNVK